MWSGNAVDITVEPDGGPIWLELVGPLGTREVFVRASRIVSGIAWRS